MKCLSKLIYPILLMVMLSACQAPVKDPASPLYSVPAGSSLELIKPLTIPAGAARVYLQNGKAYPRQNQVNQYSAYCELEVLTLAGPPGTLIQPDTFTIRKVVDEMFSQKEPVMYASRFLSDLTPLLMAYNTIYYLESSRQPDVYRLMCLYWSDVSADDFLSFTEIRQTLHGLIRFNLKTL